MNIGVILSAGDSQRFGGTVYKQYVKVNGKEVVFYTIDKMRKDNRIDDVILVVDNKEFESKYIENKYNIRCIEGGKTRNQSIKKALDYIKNNYDCDKVVFHDSIRPATPQSWFGDCIDMLDDCDAVITMDKIDDATVDKDYRAVDRSKISLIQTPEAFKFDKLYSEFDCNSNSVSIVEQLKAPQIAIIQSSLFNVKVNTPLDIFVIEQLMNIDYYSINEKAKYSYDLKNIQGVLLLGGSGGIGQCLQEYFIKNNINYYAPTHNELNLLNITVQTLEQYVQDKNINCIINAGAIYYDDSINIVDTFDKIFNINLKSNLVLVDYAKTLKKPINIVALSSSSCTRGRENLTNYSAAKTALNRVVQSLGRVLAMDNIFFNAVSPEKVNTPLIEKLHKQKISTRELLEPEDVINAIMYLATNNVYGKIIHVRKGI